MRRLAAFVAAVALVAGAWAVRDLIEGDDGSGDPAGGGDVPARLRLTCATELEDVCRGLVGDRDDVVLTVEDPGATADGLTELPSGGDPGFDAWLAAGPWAAMVADDRQFAGVPGQVVGEPSDVLGRSPAVLVVSDGLAEALPDGCEPRVSWKCLAAGDGPARIGLPSPERGDGLTVLAGAVGEQLGIEDYSTNDFDTPGFSGWFDRLTDVSSAGRFGRQSPLDAALTQAGRFDVVGALEAQSTSRLRTRDSWATTYPLPVVTADVTLVPSAGLDADEVLDRLGSGALADALISKGWRVDGSVPEGADAELELPEGSGLPAPGVLQQLRNRW